MSDYFYDYEYDTTYCYPQANVLKNKLNIKDADSLLEAERSITALRILELKQSYPDGELDFSYLKHLHFYIFQDIYGWAGKTRTVNISKGSQFCLCQFIDDQAIELFQKLERENYLVDAENIAERLSFYLSELNAIHPFREGNGRAQRMFIEILADRARCELSRTFLSNSKRSYILRTSSRSRRRILSCKVSFAVSLKWIRTR